MKIIQNFIVPCIGYILKKKKKNKATWNLKLGQNLPPLPPSLVVDEVIAVAEHKLH